MKMSSPQRVFPYQGNRVTDLGGVTWEYRDRAAYEFFPTHVIAGLRASTPARQGVELVVNYQAKTWSRRDPQVQLGLLGGSGCRDHQNVGDAYAVSASFIRTTLACGGFVLAGHRTVDGVEVLKITATPKAGTYPVTLYVDPATYLPVRMVVGPQRTDYRWLPPSKASLAHLRVTVPTGFRRVSDAGGNVNM